MVIFSMAPQITSYILLNLGHTTKIAVGASDLSSLLKNAGNKVLPGWANPEPLLTPLIKITNLQ